MKSGLFKTGVLLLLVSLLLPASSSTAQDREIALVYTNLQNEVVLYDSVDDSYTTLQAVEVGVAYDYQMLLSPTGNHVAIYTSSFEREAFRQGDNSTNRHQLRVFSLPDGEMMLERDLLPETYEFPPANGAEAGTQSAELPLALGEVVWSADGDKLAWVEGNAVDASVATFTPSANEVINLPSETGYPDHLVWSPDGEKIAYQAVESFGEGRDITAYGGYVVASDGSSSAALEIEFEKRFWLIDWISENDILWAPYSALAGAEGLQVYDIDTQTSEVIIERSQSISIAAWDEVSGTIAFAVPDLGTEETPQTGLGAGAYLMESLDAEPTLVYEADNLFGVTYMAPGYLAVGNDVIVRVSDGTQFMLDELRWPTFRPDGTAILGERQSTTVIRDLVSGEEQVVQRLFFVDGSWFNNDTFIAKIGAYGSVIGWGNSQGQFEELVNDAGNGPFVGIQR